MVYRDSVTIHEPKDSLYGQKIPGVGGHIVRAIVEQTSGMVRGGSYDAATGDARAYLDGKDSWLKSIGYLIEGYFLSVNLYGITQTYRIVNVAVGRAVVTNGEVQHIEVELERVDMKPEEES